MIGQTISHYKILEKLGEGGMGVVYKAQDTRLNRLVALKFLPHHVRASRDESSRLLQEARAAARLSHPNIATVFDFDAVEDPVTHVTYTFIAMEYVEGETLKSLIRRGRLPIDRARSIAVQLAQAFHVAHGKGIIHRDLKPANVIITGDGTAKVLDFGVAKLMGETSLSQSGDIIGTIAYMSPEQIQGGAVDARSDIWSLGVTLFEMLTQRLPFNGEHTPALMYSINNQESLNLKELRPDVSDELAVICSTCLEKDPAKRFQSASSLLRTLGVTSSLPAARFDLWRRQSVAARIAFVTVVILIAALSILQLEWQWGERRGHPNPATSSDKAQLSILPFQIDSGLNELAEWPTLIQQHLTIELAGNPSCVVREPFSLNTSFGSRLAGFDPRRNNQLYRNIRDDGVSLIIDGMITQADAQYLIRVFIINLESMTTTYQDTALVQIRRDLLQAIRRIARKIFLYLVSDKQQELRSWLAGGTLNLDALRAFQRASEYNFKGQPGAEKYNRLALAFDSMFVPPRIWLISGLVNRRKLEEAKDHYHFLLSLQPTTNPFLQEMIDWAEAKISGDSAAQLHHLENALEYSSRDNLLLTTIGSLRSKLGDNRGALDALLEVARSRWQNSPFMFELARCYAAMKMYPEARTTLDSALVTKPVYHQIYALRAVLALIDQDTAESRRMEEETRRQARFLGRSLDRANADLGSLFRSHGFLNEAIRCYRSAVAMNSGTPQYYDALAEVLWHCGKTNEATSNYLQALSVDRSWINAHWALGRIFESSGDLRKAREQYIAFLKQDSTSASALIIKQRLAQLGR